MTNRATTIRPIPSARTTTRRPYCGGLSAHLSWSKAVVIGALQGVAELFPVSSLGHSVLVPAVIGGTWARDLDVSAPDSPYLAFVVGLHVATAVAMVVHFWADWLRVARRGVPGLVPRVGVRGTVFSSD